MTEKRSKSIHYQAILQWFFKIFIIIALVFCIALIPLFASMKNTFSKLQEEKRRQLLLSGTSQISSVVRGMINTSDTLLSDQRFLQLHYKNVDSNEISVSTQRQLRHFLTDLTISIEPLKNITLLLDKNAVVSKDALFFDNDTDYYPTFFQADNMSYDEWVNLLKDTGTGFTPVHHIKTYSSEYDAITFVTPWSNTSYIYTCLPVTTLKEMVMEESTLSNCYFSITTKDENVLYTDLPNDAPKHLTFTEDSALGNIRVSVHIPNSIFYEDMSSFYLFFALYVISCFALLLAVSFVGSRHAAKPVMNIIDILEQSRYISSQGSNSGFDFISNSIQAAEHNIATYQSTLNMQQKMLQTRFFEKAISGQLVSKSDIQNFQSYFPDFPNSYRILLIKLWSYTNNNSPAPYQDPLLLLHTFLEQELPDLYQHQINDTELLFIVSEENFEASSQTLNFIINNINQEEPSYHAYCIASSTYYNLNDLPIAYQQIRSVDGASFTDYQSQICTVTDSQTEEGSKIPVTMIDLMTLYTAITSGNLELALNRLASYSDELNTPENTAFIKPVFDMIKSMLTYIKIDYLQLLLDQHIPSFQPGKSLYEQLAHITEAFCDLINGHNNTDKDSFTQELFSYIDAHYTDSDICLTSLKNHFKCSESTVRKVFKRVTDVPIARYIEQKRMILAYDLLAKNELSVTEIAHKCGYSLPHSFYKAYKRVYGHAPTLPNTANADSNI